MKSIREIYKIGRGPSSSHTMGPEKACMIFKGENPEADSFKVILYGSLASTGEGHGTDRIIKETLAPIEVEIVLDLETQDLPHENTMDLFAYRSGEQIGKMRVMSVGGGDIEVEGRSDIALPEIYEESSLTAIIDYCRHKNIRLSKFVFEKEGEGIKEFLYKVWQCMDNEIEEGLMADGILPGGLNVMRVANLLYNKRHIDERPETKENRIVCAYAFAAAEQNAGGGTIITAPTCGACAVLPAVLKYMKEKKNFSDDDVIRALAVAGLIGTLVKHNASISGAECGCQAEIGTASAMAAAALCEIFEMGYGQIEYAAEMCIEHHLGLTCDPLCGLVQIPCIERNAVAAMRAMSALSLANFLVGTRKISFDMVVKTMYETGKDLHSKYRETSTGGLAKLYGQI
ncbi:MAG: L-serine ammonia-lyase, iron-sulfur-dependent, subunit alpha [Clostridia bacterium]|nr:L-serine ammonia-lyase, iron-sulfur-dependent, subunit alpha [Clostridia bacterium]